MTKQTVALDPLLQHAPAFEGYRVLGGVALYQKLGQGGMGAVFRGRHLRLNVDVAVKVLSMRTGATPEAVNKSIKRFMREAQSAASVRHQNLIRVMDVNAEAGTYYLVMDFIDGESALERLQRKRQLSEAEVLQICVGAAEGLAAAHRKGIVHRDVKPDNILVDKDGNVVVADLGIAKAYSASPDSERDRLTRTQDAIGTPDYMPPEQFMSAKAVAPAADVWSLGVTMYELLTDSLPWYDESIFALANKIAKAPLPDIKEVRGDLSGGMCELIARMLEKDPGKRCPDCAGVATTLRELLASAGSVSLSDDAAGSERKFVATDEPPSGESLSAIEDAVTMGRTVSPKADTAVLRSKASLGDVVEKRLHLQERLDALLRDDPSQKSDVMSSMRMDLRVAEALEGKNPDAAFERLERAAEVLEELVKAIARERLSKKRGRRAAFADPAPDGGATKTNTGRAAAVITGFALPPRTLKLGEGRKLRLVYAPHGAFTMGAQNGIIDAPVHEVVFPKGFYIGKFLVTQQQYELVMGRNPAQYTGPERPVEGVSWHEAVRFCRRLSERTGQAVRLPSEAEWEYACRAGSKEIYAFGAREGDLSRFAWFDENSGHMHHGVGQKKPNLLGLFDMHGNVREWCMDRYAKDYYRKSPRNDPRGPDEGEHRVVRGGAWQSRAYDCRADVRGHTVPGMGDTFTGFRVVMPLGSA